MNTPYTCVLCNIKIENPVEIGAHLKVCFANYGGLYMTENGPRRIHSDEQLTNGLVSLCLFSVAVDLVFDYNTYL